MAADLRQAGLILDRRYRDRRNESGHHLGWNWRVEQLTKLIVGRWSLQIGERRQDMAAHGPPHIAAHRPDSRSSDQPRYRLRRIRRPPLDERRRARPLQDDRWWEDLEADNPHQ